MEKPERLSIPDFKLSGIPVLFGRGDSSRWAALFAMSALRWRASVCEDESRTEAAVEASFFCAGDCFFAYVVFIRY